MRKLFRSRQGKGMVTVVMAFAIWMLVFGLSFPLHAGEGDATVTCKDRKVREDGKEKVTGIDCEVTDEDGIVWCVLYMYEYDSEKKCYRRAGARTIYPDREDNTKAHFSVSNAAIKKYLDQLEVYDRGPKGKTRLDSCHQRNKNARKYTKDCEDLTICKKEKAAPTLTEWGLIVLGMLLAGSLAWMIRRRVITRPSTA